jgi:hypothetical protein
MKTKTYTTIDRKGWAAGAWDGEPDKMQWQDEATKLPCLAVRHQISGHWCGYVGVADGHPCYGVEYSNVDVEVHGGLTFSSMCDPKESEAEGICHVPDAGEPDQVWWLGFDCAHCGDARPAPPMDLISSELSAAFARIFNEGTYRTLAYVQQECASLAKQLSEMKT